MDPLVVSGRVLEVNTLRQRKAVMYLFIYFMVLRKAPNDAHKNRLIKNSLTDNLNLNIESIPYISQIDLIYLHSFS